MKFLNADPANGEVPLITIDIGANDLDGCAAASKPLTCAATGADQIATHLPTILNAIRTAAPRGATLVSMNLYDPVLGSYFAPPGSAANRLVGLSVPLVKHQRHGRKGQRRRRVQDRRCGHGLRHLRPV